MSTLRAFIEQLRRRHVFKVGAAYAIVGWVVIQVSTTVAPHLLLPEWLPRVIIFMVLLGFPVALVLAWAYDITPDGLRATDLPGGEGATGSLEVPSGAAHEAPRPSNVGNSPASRLPIPRPLGFTALGLGITAVGFAAWLGIQGQMGGGAPSLTGEALLVELETLAEASDFPGAFALLEAGGGANESVPAALRALITDRFTVLSEPGGARVRARRFVAGSAGDGGEEGWLDLGVTPLHGLLLPRGDYLLRVEREGYAPVERIASTASLRTGTSVAEVPESLVQVGLVPEETVPEGMVFVPGGAYSLASRNLQGLLANLGDFFLDRFEVTNEAYGRFVVAGGYRDRSHWEELFLDPAVDDPDETLGAFLDRTRLPGPRGWSGQTPPEGQGDHPVTGVTWYEAAAYCRFLDRRLPTLFEWEKAARDGEITIYAAIQLPWGPLSLAEGSRGRANFGSNGTTPVHAHPFGLSPYGVYDMAGNVKEWIANETEIGRAVTGGSWEDPVYLFPEVGSLAPVSTSPSLGFRCARSADGGATSGDRGGIGPLRLTVETPEYQPVGDETFAGLLSHYAYDRRPVTGEIVARYETPSWTRERILFDGPGDEKIIAYLYLPESARPPYQTLILVPGLHAFFGGSVPDITEWLLAPVIRSGRAVFTVVLEGMTERNFPPGFQPPAPASARFRDLVVHHATELRMGLDYLESRDDIDLGALGYVGQSWGAGSRLIFAAVDDRFRSVIFIGGGIDERVHPTLPEASNINFAPRIRAPTLLLNGREDEEHVWHTRGLPLWTLLSEPKELVLIDGAGHVPPLQARIPPMLDFLDNTLGPVVR